MLTAPYKTFMGADPGQMTGVVMPTQAYVQIPMVIVALAQEGSLEHMSITAEDSAKLVVATLESLAKMGSEWATMMLDANKDILEVQASNIGSEEGDDEDDDEGEDDDLREHVPA
jgi:hypothetical protein